MNTPLNPAAALVQPLSKSAADRNFADSTPGPGKGATPEVGGTWGKGIFTITTDPADGGIVLQGRDILTQQAVPALHIQDWEGLFPALQQPENEAFLKLVVGVMTPMAGKTVGDFTRWAMERNPTQEAPISLTEGQQKLTPQVATPLNEGLAADKFYYVAQQAGQRYVRVATGFLLKEGAETVGRMSGKAVKRPGNLHEILVLTGAQVLAEGIELR